MSATATLMITATDLGTGNERAGAVLAAVVALTGVVIGGLALARSAGRNGAVAAMAAGLGGIVLAGLHLATSSGGFGTGNGRAGAFVAMALGLIGMLLGLRVAARARRRPMLTR